MNYILKQINENVFYLLCMNYLSILNYLDEIENEEYIKQNTGTLIIDQLLVSGNGKNRFLVCKFSHGVIDLCTAENINANDNYRMITAKLLREKYEYLKYSILTDNQKEMIKIGQIV